MEEVMGPVSEPSQGPISHGCEDNWTWSKKDASHEVRLHGPGNRVVLFHPNWSSGTAGVRGHRVLNNGRYYWEVRLSHRIFGTSMMVGIGTAKARLHADRFINLLGEDENGWGLSHKGLLWHQGKWSPYTKPFRENEPTTVGVLFDGIAGTLSYYKDCRYLGVAFQGLDKVNEPLYPIVCSTAAKTEMTLSVMRRDFVSLQDRCRAVIVTKIMDSVSCASEPAEEDDNALNNVAAAFSQPLETLTLPTSLKGYLAETLNVSVTHRMTESFSRKWHHESSPRLTPSNR
ncbi:SPRY domain-containing SOCS box protein 3-like [Cloeon dipterum]|uniref:B30.2/SPRY domain-containing protein n=1 Tax=Cloeon dipterum TaxID=197152 RepID=A0A8S1CUI6_9INSE|nr:Hypothetical predicted protein [Cloeon dipterum]